mgnify:CR=1 FL=1
MNKKKKQQKDICNVNTRLRKRTNETSTGRT